MNTLLNFDAILAQKNALEAALKARCAIYQVEAKEDAARAFGMPLDAYYHLPFSQWSEISRAFVAKREKVEQECIDMGMPGSMPWNQFPHYRKQMGLDRFNSESN